MRLLHIAMFVLEVFSLLLFAMNAFGKRKHDAGKGSEPGRMPTGAKAFGNWFGEGMITGFKILKNITRVSQEVIRGYIEFCFRWVNGSVLVSLVLAGGMMAGLYLKLKWLTLFCATSIGAIAFVTYVMISPLILSFEMIIGTYPRLKDEIDEMGRRVCRVFFYFFIPVALLWLIPANSSIGTIFMLFLLIGLLGMGTLGKIFPAPFVIRPTSGRFLLVSMLVVTVIQLFLPTFTTYAKWGLGRTVSFASPHPSVIPDERILKIEDWFNHATGGPNYFFEEENSTVVIYDAPGNSPRTGKELLPLDDSGKIREIIGRARSRREQIAKEAARKEQESRSVDEKLRLEREANEISLAKQKAAEERIAERKRFLSDRAPGNPGNKLELMPWAIDCEEKPISEALELGLQIPGQLFGLFRPAFYKEGKFDQMWEGDIDVLGELLPEQRFNGIKLAKLKLSRSTNSSLGLITTTGSFSIKSLNFSTRTYSSVHVIEAKGLGHTKEHSERDLLKKLTEALTKPLP